jgi:DNA-binding LacI/PurR family transcriptional regulator
MRGLPVPSVSTDSAAASETAVKWLLDQGRRNIAFYSGPVQYNSTIEDRQQGFFKGLVSNGISCNSAHVCDTLPSIDCLDIIMRHLSGNPELDAAFTAEFEIALLVRRALAALGRKIPRDFSLVTFDGSAYASEYLEFAWLRQDEDSIGKQAVEILHRIIQGESRRSFSDVLIPAELIQGNQTQLFAPGELL